MASLLLIFFIILQNTSSNVLKRGGRQMSQAQSLSANSLFRGRWGHAARIGEIRFSMKEKDACSNLKDWTNQ